VGYALATMSKQIVRNVSFGLAAQLIVKLLSFAFNVFVVRVLGSTAFGQYSTINAYGQLFLFVADLGLSTYAIRLIAQRRGASGGGVPADKSLDDLYANLIALRLLLALLSAAMAIGAAWLTGRADVILLAMSLNAVSLLLYGWQSASAIVLSGLERFDLTARAQVLFQFLVVCAGAIALWFNFGYIGLIVGNIGAVLVFAMICARQVRANGVRAGSAEPRSWRATLLASAPFAVLSLALGLSYKFDTVLIEYFHGASAAGYYNAAYNLIFNCVMFSNILNTTLYPALSRQAASDASALPAAYERALRYLMIVALPLTIGIFMLSDDLIPFLFKAEYSPAAAVLMILIWVVPLQYASEFLGYVILIANRERIVARSVVISSAVNVLANLALVPLFGLRGAALMTVLTELVLVTQYVWLLRDQLRGLDWTRYLLRPLLAALAMGALIWALAPLPWVARALIGGVAYAGLLLASRTIGREEIAFVRALRARS
jgi:O-antigen/teichoic acid export membrane protein